nr:hypothetical protein [Pantoea allii]
MRTAHGQHVITEHQQLIYNRPVLNKVQDRCSVQRIGIVRAFDNDRCMR